MSVLYLTVFLSVCLAILFMVFFIVNFKSEDSGSPEHDALIPFSDEPRSRSGNSQTQSVESAADPPASNS